MPKAAFNETNLQQNVFLEFWKRLNMSGYGQKIQKVMVQPINLVFRFFQKKLRVQVF